jgi:hypothetical protein
VRFAKRSKKFPARTFSACLMWSVKQGRRRADALGFYESFAPSALSNRMILRPVFCLLSPGAHPKATLQREPLGLWSIRFSLCLL